MTSDVVGWLERRLEQVPEELGPWLAPDAATEDGDAVGGREVGAVNPATDGGSGPSGVPDELARRGLRALDAALARPGRNRETAFRLLAADAYLTWACAAILEGPEPEAALEGLIRRIGADVE